MHNKNTAALVCVNTALTEYPSAPSPSGSLGSWASVRSELAGSQGESRTRAAAASRMPPRSRRVVLRDGAHSRLSSEVV